MNETKRSITKAKTKLSHISWINGIKKEISYQVPQVGS